MKNKDFVKSNPFELPQMKSIEDSMEWTLLSLEKKAKPFSVQEFDRFSLNSKFNWNGLIVNIIPSEYDLKRVKTTKKFLTI
jgi:hypothetical protein